MSVDLEKAILKRTQDLELKIDGPEFSKKLSELLEVFYAHVQALGAKYGVALTVESNLKIEVIEKVKRKRKPRR